MNGHRMRRRLRAITAVLACLLSFALAAPAAYASTRPIVSGLSVSAVSETAATLHATLNPGEKKVTDYHFEYITQASYEADGESFGEGTEKTLSAELDGTAAELKEGHPVQVPIEGLDPGTPYRFRLFAKNERGPTTEPEAFFATLAPAPTFGSCENDAFRSGALALPGDPAAFLPDCRAYEQASPTDKNGNDILGTRFFAHASIEGDRVSFQAAGPLPQGESAQTFKPQYLARRGPGGWSTIGLSPPQSAGENAHLAAWTPDFGHFFTWSYKLGEPRVWTLLERSSADGSVFPIVPSRPTGMIGEEDPELPAASEDGSVVFFESEGSPLLPGAAAGPHRQSLYAWDRDTGRLRLAGAMNSLEETEALLSGGSLAGLDWIRPNHFGTGARSYARERRAASADGSSVYFTSLGSGQLYRRLNPTAEQSPLDGQRQCADPALACTYHVSASEKTNGTGATGEDPGGPQPAKFMAASADGERAFFISSEKLTDDANTGPEQPEAAIGRATVGAEEPEGPEDPRPDFLPAHALGTATDPSGAHLYWANPAEHSIGRATIDPAACAPAPAPCEVEPQYISPEAIETCLETRPHVEPGVKQCAASPRYVAVDAGHLYWTNTGPVGGEEQKDDRGLVWEPHEEILDGAGAIGRATTDPAACSPDPPPCDSRPEFITGASNPQGIAVNSEHIYWANNGHLPFNFSTGRGTITLARAASGGGEVNQLLWGPASNDRLSGVALDSNHVYVGNNSGGGEEQFGSIDRLPLDGAAYQEEDEGLEFRGLGGLVGVRGLAVQGTRVYWSGIRRQAIGRAGLASFGKVGSDCEPEIGCEPEWLQLPAGPFGLASDPESHLYFSLNGEAQPNPGADLYRYSATPDAEGHHLTDLVADPTAAGAEVCGVIGASADGASLYFLAHAALPGALPNPAGESPTAATGGACNLYLWREDPGTHAAETTFIARLGEGDRDDWRPEFSEAFMAGSQFSFPNARVAPDGGALAFAATERLTAYDNHGLREYYLYRPGRPLTCLTCNPTGAPPLSGAPPGLDIPTGIGGLGLGANPPAPVFSRNLSASGERFFFETAEALVGSDTNSALDAYQWEAPGKGSCSEASTSYSPQDEGCLYLLSPPGNPNPSYLLDADREGDNAFIFTRSRLVGQDTDGLRDVYDARSGGGLSSQFPPPPPIPCGGEESCKPQVTPPPALTSPTTPEFHGPTNLHEKPCPKGKVRRGQRCVRKHHLFKKHHQRPRHRKPHHRGPRR